MPAGQAAGMFGILCSHPFDTLKTRMQVETYKSFTDATKTIIKKEGARSLYRGMVYPFLGFGTIFSIAFGVNGTTTDYIRQQHVDPNYQLNLWEMMGCGALAGSASSIPRTAIERVKCWSQVHKIGTWAATKHLIKTQGMKRGPFYGVMITQYREVPQFMVYYPIYEFCVRLLAPGKKKSEMSTMVTWLSGASAGVGCWLLNYPTDVVKTRMQSAEPGIYSSFIQCARVTYAEGGWRIFFRGLVPTCIRAVFLHSGIFVMYEQVYSALGGYEEDAG